MPVLFVRELTSSGDLILAFDAEGSPVWALDRDSGIQWWYAGDRPEVHAAVAEHWDSFATMPITAASYAGPHPAWELRRRAALRPRPVETAPPSVEHPVVPWLRGVRAKWRHLSSGARILVASVAVLTAFALVPWALGVVLPAQDRPNPAPRPAAAAPRDGGPCTVRGETSTAPDGRLLVCAPASRALSYDLTWRATG